MQRGDIVICVLSGDYGKTRPVVIAQSDLFNTVHTSFVVCPITSHLVNAPLFRLMLRASQLNGLKTDSQIMVDKLVAVPVSKIKDKIGELNRKEVKQLNEALRLWLGL